MEYHTPGEVGCEIKYSNNAFCFSESLRPVHSALRRCEFGKAFDEDGGHPEPVWQEQRHQYVLWGEGRGDIRSVQRADGAAVTRASDLQRVGQTAAGVAGVAHGVEGFTGKLCRALHQTTGPHVGHVSGHHDGSNTLGTQAVGDDIYQRLVVKI